MGGQARGLHRHHLAVLVEADKRDQRRKENRIGQKPRDELRDAQSGIGQQFGLTVPLHREDFAAGREQVQHQQDEHQHHQHRQDTGDEHLCEIERQRARGEEIELHGWRRVLFRRDRIERRAALRVGMRRLIAHPPPSE